VARYKRGISLYIKGTGGVPEGKKGESTGVSKKGGGKGTLIRDARWELGGKKGPQAHANQY